MVGCFLFILAYCYLCSTGDACVEDADDCDASCPDDSMCKDLLDNSSHVLSAQYWLMFGMQIALVVVHYY